MEFISGKFSGTQWNYAALVREAFLIYMPIKRLSFSLQDAECPILCDHKSPEKFLKDQPRNNKVNSWSIEISYKLKTEYIKGTVKEQNIRVTLSGDVMGGCLVPKPTDNSDSSSVMEQSQQVISCSCISFIYFLSLALWNILCLVPIA